MTNETIQHLTLMTGHLRQSPRSEVQDRTIDLIRPAVLAGYGKLGETGWSIRMYRAIHDGGAAFECHFEGGHESLWVACCYMAWQDAAAAEMWHAASQHPLVSPSVRRPQRLPWLATALMPPAFHRLDLAFEVADLERCVAWSVLHVCQHTGRGRAA